MQNTRESSKYYLTMPVVARTCLDERYIPLYHIIIDRLMNGGKQGKVFMTVRFQDLASFTSDDVDAAITRNDPDELQFVPITIALSSSELALAQEVCIKLSMHEHHKVRGNAVMSLGHLARRFRVLDEDTVRPILESALRDQDEYVKMLAKSAADEIQQFLHRQIAGHVYG
jgi:hypothetical protein